MKFKPYKELTRLEKRSVKYLGGYNRVKKTVRAQQELEDKRIFNIFNNGFNANYTNK